MRASPRAPWLGPEAEREPRSRSLLPIPTWPKCWPTWPKCWPTWPATRRRGAPRAHCSPPPITSSTSQIRALESGPTERTREQSRGSLVTSARDTRDRDACRRCGSLRKHKPLTSRRSEVRALKRDRHRRRPMRLRLVWSRWIAEGDADDTVRYEHLLGRREGTDDHLEGGITDRRLRVIAATSNSLREAAPFFRDLRNEPVARDLARGIDGERRPGRN